MSKTKGDESYVKTLIMDDGFTLEHLNRPNVIKLIYD